MIQPSLGQSGGRFRLLMFFGRSCGLWCPTPRACRLATPVRAAAGEVLSLADQALVELAGKQWDLGLTKMMAKGTTGEADLLATAGDQQGRIEVGPAFWGLEERWGHGRAKIMRTPVLAGGVRFCLLGSGGLAGWKRSCSIGPAVPRAEGRRVFWPQWPTLSIRRVVSIQPPGYQLPPTGRRSTWAAQAVRPAKL